MKPKTVKPKTVTIQIKGALAHMFDHMLRFVTPDWGYDGSRDPLRGVHVLEDAKRITLIATNHFCMTMMRALNTKTTEALQEYRDRNLEAQDEDTGPEAHVANFTLHAEGEKFIDWSKPLKDLHEDRILGQILVHKRFLQEALHGAGVDVLLTFYGGLQDAPDQVLTLQSQARLPDTKVDVFTAIAAMTTDPPYDLDWKPWTPKPPKKSAER